jgi:hypothetical protein
LHIVIFKFKYVHAAGTTTYLKLSLLDNHANLTPLNICNQNFSNYLCFGFGIQIKSVVVSDTHCTLFPMHAQVCQNVRSQLHLLFHTPAPTFFHAVAHQQLKKGQGEFTF